MSGFWRRIGVPVRLVLAALLSLVCGAAFAQDKAQLHTSIEDGFGRLMFEFPDRLDLPAYKLSFDNGVLAVTFTDAIAMALPDVSATMPDYLTVGRVDPDQKGVRFGLRRTVNVHTIEAGEKLFVDLLPMTWQGLPPSLPPEVVAELTRRAKDAAQIAEQKRKSEDAKRLNPRATLRVGRNPTFMRVEFDWNVETEAKYAQDGDTATITFDWPVDIDLFALKTNLPGEISAVTNASSAAGSMVKLTLAEGVTPRFYGTKGTNFTLDIDLSSSEAAKLRITAEAAAAQAEADALAKSAAKPGDAAEAGPAEPQISDEIAQGPITPTVDVVSGTVRVRFPFERDVASAAFRRGDTLWMVFDTATVINAPEPSDALDSIASAFIVVPAGDTQIVRIDLSSERLTTLASEGRSWVLSVGDVLLNPTEPVALARNRDEGGRFEMRAALGKPNKVHSFRDPQVGDVLEVVTAFAPARGTIRDLGFVDFDALRSVHGLVLRPVNADLQVAIANNAAVISAPQGLTLSDQDAPRALDSGNASEFRDSYVDFAQLREDDPGALEQRLEKLSDNASEKEGQAREVARLSLAQFYVGNQFAQEALGVLKVLQNDLKSDDLREKAQLTKAIANVLAVRPREALEILNGPSFSDEIDAVMWRAMARTESGDFVGGRSDTLASESAIESYPVWVQQKFLFAGIRAAVETSDPALAQRYLGELVFAQLSPEDITLYQLMQGRVAEMQGRTQEALDIYGQVIAADVRPTRAEAVYRTLLVLRSKGEIDLVKATETLSAEALLWRGDALEADMDKLLAELYFENKDYRRGFEIAKATAEYFPDSRTIDALTEDAQAQFSDLFLNGAADQLSDLDALSLYYDFRQLTPPGARGDEMIRNLARRLVKVDLLSQAADLLEYQIESRLSGAAQAQVATEMAVIRIADRNPESALNVLGKTRIEGLSPSLERQRRILEVRALIDAGREDLALDLIGKMTGRDVDLLRVDGYWKAKNYSAASDLIETIYSGDLGEQLSDLGRKNILKAGVGLVLANDRLGLNRLRTKFSDHMAQSEEWGMFDYLTGAQVSVSGKEFKDAARLVAGLDSINAFLDAYRQVYSGDAELTPAEASSAGTSL